MHKPLGRQASDGMAALPPPRYHHFRRFEENAMSRVYNAIDADGHVLEPTTL